MLNNELTKALLLSTSIAYAGELMESPSPCSLNFAIIPITASYQLSTHSTIIV